MKKTLLLFLIILSFAVSAFSMPEKKIPPKQSLADISFNLLNKATNNPGIMQTAKWKNSTLYLMLLPMPDYLGRPVYKIGVSQRARSPYNIYRQFRRQLPSGYKNIDGVEMYTEHKGKQWYIWEEIPLFDRPKPGNRP